MCWRAADLGVCCHQPMTMFRVPTRSCTEPFLLDAAFRGRRALNQAILEQHGVTIVGVAQPDSAHPGGQTPDIFVP